MDTNTLVLEIVNKIKKLPINTETTIAELINYNPNENIVEIHTQVQIFNKVEEICRKENIYIEGNKDEKVGLPFYSKFKKINLNIINEFKINNNIVFEDEETKIEYQKYLDEINEYNRKVLNGEETDVDLSEIMSKFKEKFDVEGVKTTPVDDKEFKELLDKFNRNLDKNLTIDEQIKNIDKKIEELNKQEENQFDLNYFKNNLNDIFNKNNNFYLHIKSKNGGKLVSNSIIDVPYDIELYKLPYDDVYKYSIIINNVQKYLNNDQIVKIINIFQNEETYKKLIDISFNQSDTDYDDFLLFVVKYQHIMFKFNGITSAFNLMYIDNVINQIIEIINE